MGNRIQRVIFAVIAIIMLTSPCPAGQAAAGDEWSNDSNESGFYGRIMIILKVPPRFEQPSSAVVTEKKETSVITAPVVTEKKETPVIAAPVVTEKKETPVIAAPVITEKKETPVIAAPVITEKKETPGIAAPVVTEKKETPVIAAPVVTEKQEALLVTPPAVSEKRDTPIFGHPEVTKEQLISFIRRHNPFPKLGCSIEELVALYYEEAGQEGVRPDLALVQALHETGFFRFGGDVLPEQNNFAGIGTTGNGVRGVWFSSPRLGVRAHIQHLLAYATTREPVEPIIDPRYYIVRDMPTHFAQCSTWESLSGKWAVPGVNYGRKIVKMLDNIRDSQ